jgi:hypothetical protein
MEEKEKKKSCNHEGHFRSVGVVSVNEPKSMSLIVVLFCEKCGEAMAKNIRLQKFEIPTAKVQMPMARKGN